MENAENRHRRITRRELLIGGGLVLAAGGTAAILDKKLRNPEERIDPDEKDMPRFEAPFKSFKANEIAQAKGINAGSFFSFNPDVINSLSGFRDHELFPIFPPSVIDHKDLIYDLVDNRDFRDFEVPPTILATIMAIESAGNVNAESWVKAQGLFQVMPDHFQADGIADDPEAMRNPLTNGRKAMEIFTQDCLRVAREAYPELPPHHPVIYARALMGYNGGPDEITKDFADIPEETKFYGDHMIRYLMTAEIAKGLRDQGFSDREIVRKLSSPEIDARADAMHSFDLIRNGKYSYDEYSEALQEVAYPTPGVDPISGQISNLGRQIQYAYDAYMRDPYYVTPASPGARIWIEMKGLALLSEEDKTQPDRWFKMNSRRD